MATKKCDQHIQLDDVIPNEGKSRVTKKINKTKKLKPHTYVMYICML